MKNNKLKNFIRLLALVLTITSVTGTIENQNVSAIEHSNNEITQEDLHKNNLQKNNEVEIIDKTKIDSEPVIDLVKDDIDLKANIQYDLDSHTMDVKGSYIDENGQLINKQYNVLIDQLENEEYEATFIDKDTGETIEYNSIKAQSSAWPLVIIAVVARYGIKYAAKNYGKKATTNAIKAKSFGKVLPSIANLGANKRRHILSSKHNWNKVTTNNWNSVSKVMSHVMRHGKQSKYKKNAYKKTLNMSGRTVVVTYTRKNGKIYVSNGWVR
jgi:hypothetical protein